MKLTYFRRHTDPGATVDVTWDDFVADLMRDPPVVPVRDDRSAIGPYVLRGPRSDANVVTMTLQAFDYDRLTLPQVEHVVTRFSRFQGLIYTTWSHYTDKGLTLRVLLPREDPVHAWQKHRRRIEAYVGIPSDKATHDPSRIFYLPCSRPGDPPPSFCVLRGPPLDPFALPGSRQITAEDFEELTKKLAYRARCADHPEKRRRINVAKKALDAVLEGRPYADEGEIDPTLVSLIGHFKSAWGTDVDTDSILAIMGRSLATMPADRSHDHARERLERLFAQARAEERDETEERIRQHFKPLGRTRTEPYTADEIAYMRASYCDGDDMAYVVQAAGRVYSLTIDGYQDRGRADMPDVIRALYPFPDVNFRTSSGGSKPIRTLLEEYGQHVQTLEYDYMARAATCSGERLVLPAGQRRQIEPAYDPEIEAWLAVLAGERLPALLEWLAWVPHLDQALAALFLHGPPSTGKSLFAKALARLWGTPTAMHHALGDFNDDLIRSPLVLADEHFPKHTGGRYKTEEFRNLVQSNTHQINGKFKALVTLRGFTRSILTANNKHIFRMAGNVMSKDDLDAVASRILRIEVPLGSAAVLRRLDTASIANTDRLAAHVLTFPRPTTAHRFGISPQPLDYSLVVDQFVPGHVCELLFAHLAGPKFPPGYRVHGGALYVLPGSVRLSHELKVRPGHLHEAIESLSDGRDGDELRIAHRALLEYGATAGHTPEWIEERLAAHEQANQKEAN